MLGQIVCVGCLNYSQWGQSGVNGHAFDVLLTTAVPAVTSSFVTSFGILESLFYEGKYLEQNVKWLMARPN